MLQYLPLLILLACPLMMVFMMRGMHGAQGSKSDSAETSSPRQVTDQATASRVVELERQVQELRTRLAAEPGDQPTDAEPPSAAHLM